jgi:hypothetical protein
LLCPAFQKLCKEKHHNSIVTQTTPPSRGVKAGAPSKTVINYSRLSDGEGVYSLTPAVRVHRSFVAPRTKAERAAKGAEELLKVGRPKTRAQKQSERAKKQRQKWREEGVLNTSPEVKLPKLNKQERKLRKKLAALGVSPVARPRDLNQVAAELLQLREKAARLSEEVKASSCKKKEQREKREQKDVIQDEILTQLEFLRTQLDANQAPTVPDSFVSAAEKIVENRKVQAEATGTQDLKMMLSLDTRKNKDGDLVQVLSLSGTWSTRSLNEILDRANKDQDLMVNLVNKTEAQKKEFTKRGFKLVAREWYCLTLEDRKEETAVAKQPTTIAPRPMANEPRLVVTKREDNYKYLHLYPNKASFNNIKQLLAEPKELDVIVNVSPEALVVRDREKFVEVLRANGFENYYEFENWLWLPAGKKFAEPTTPKVVAILIEDNALVIEDCLKLNITVDGKDIQSVLTITHDYESSYAQAEKLNLVGCLKAEVEKAIQKADKEVHFFYDTHLSIFLLDLLNSLGFSDYDSTSERWLVKRLVKRVAKQQEVTVTTKAIADIQEQKAVVVNDRPDLNPYFVAQPKAISLPIPELLTQSEGGTISNIPNGLSEVFKFFTSEAKTGKSHVILAAFSAMLNTATGKFVECNSNTPSRSYNHKYRYYGMVDKLTTEDGKDINVLSFTGKGTKGLQENITPVVLSVGTHCINGVKEEYIPTAISSLYRIDQKANIQIVLGQPGGESAKTDENAVPGLEAEARKELKAALYKGESKTIYSTLYKSKKDEQGTETSVTTSFIGEGLNSILADGKRHIFVVVAWFDETKQKFFTEGGKQYRIYPHTANVFHVDDVDKVFGGNMFAFDERAMLGLASSPTVKATSKAFTAVTERPRLEDLNTVQESISKANQESISKANIALELAELHKNIRLKGLPLSKGLTFEQVRILRKNTSADGLVAHRTLTYIKSRTGDKPVQLFDWTKEDVLKVAEVFHNLMSLHNETEDEEIFCYREIEEGLLLSFDGKTIQFLIGKDGRAYNYENGRAFEQGMELIGQNKLDMSWWESPEYPKMKAALTAARKKEPLKKEHDKNVSYYQLVNGKVQIREEYKPEIEDVCFASSIGKFMQAFCAFLLMFAQSKNNHRQGLADNFKILLNECESVFSLTEGEILSQNGGFLYSVQNSPKLFVHKTQHDIFALEDSKLKELANSVAVYVRGYNMKPPAEMLKVSSTDTQSLAMEIAFKKYPALGFHFAKGTFINGFTHLRLSILQEYAPTLFNKTLELTGLEVQEALDSVISLTLKASKGAKRATLALARAVEVEGEVKAGWAFYSQEKVLTGWLVQECMAPTFVMAPGMSFFLGDEAEKPVALVRKTQTEKYNNFLASNLAEAVSMTGVNDYVRCFPNYTATKTYDEASATYRITFDKPVKLIKDTQIAFVKKEENQGADAIISFNEYEIAYLNDITWKVHNSLQKDEKVLVVNYSYTLHHRNPKLRSVIKTMMASCDAQFLYNWFNNPKLKELGLSNIKLVAPQDTIKSDMLYSWLMVIGNTIRHNDPTNVYIAELIRLRDQLNLEIMGEAEYDRHTIIINPAAVVAGYYSQLISYFVKHFGHSLWMNVQLPGDQGKIMNQLYVDRVAHKASWVEVPEAAWGDSEKVWASHRQSENYRVKLYAESVDYLKDDKQNALLFTLDADGEVVEYLQRSFCFVGAKGAPVYGVELFESSTVAEAISDSRHMAPSVHSLSRMEGVAFDDAWTLLNAGKDKMFMSLVIAGMSSNDNFGCSKTIKIVERGADQYKNLVLSNEDKDYLNSILAQNDISLNYHEDDQFKSVAHAFRDIVFVVKGKTFWLPALYTINKLKSESSSNNLAQQFFRQILVECLAGRNVLAIEGSRADGILDSLCDSVSTKKLFTAAANVTGKRIALPHIPAGEIHILKSLQPASEYQNLLRNGFNLKEVEAGNSTIFTHNSRAPLTDGCLLKLVIVTEQENKENFWKLDSDSFALGSMGNGMDFGDFDGDGHYLVELKGTYYTVSTFESVADFISDAVGYNIFYTYANPENKKGQLNEAYLAEHYNIKKWSKVDETLCKMALRKATNSSATYLMFNQNAREMQAKATGIVYSVYMWSAYLVDILLAYKKLGGVLPKEIEAATDGSLVAPISQVYEIILGGFSAPAWTVYTKYFLKMKQGERTLFDHNLAEFNQDLINMGVTGQKLEGFNALMFASYHLFFLEKWGAFNDYEADLITKSELPLDLKGMLSCALVSFELTRGKFQGFTGALEVKNGRKVTGHTVAMKHARSFLMLNPGMVDASLVCKHLAQTIKECNHLLAGQTRPKRELSNLGDIQERTVHVPKSQLSDEALQYFLTKVGALAEVNDDDSEDEGGSNVANDPNTPDNGDGGVAVEAIDYDAYLETEEVVVKPVKEEQLTLASAVVITKELEASSSPEEYDDCLKANPEYHQALVAAEMESDKPCSLLQELIAVLSNRPVRHLESFIAEWEVDTSGFEAESGLDVVKIAKELYDNAEFYSSAETIVEEISRELKEISQELNRYSLDRKEERNLFIQERTVVVPTSNLSDEALQHSLTKVGALAEVKVDESGDEGGSKVGTEPSTPNNGDGGVAVEAMDYDAYLAPEEVVVVVEPVEVPKYEQDSSSIPQEVAVVEEPIEVIAEQVKQPVQSEVIKNGTKEKMATLMQVVEQLPESLLDQLMAEGERLLAEHNRAKKPVKEVKAVEPLKEAEPVTTLDNKSLVEVVHARKVVDAISGDRASLIGNPFELIDKNNAQERAKVINCFNAYYNSVVYFGEEPVKEVASAVEAGNLLAATWKKPSRTAFIDSLLDIWDVVEANGTAKVGCWCAPLHCHLDVIKADFEKAGSKAAWVSGIHQVEKEVNTTEDSEDNKPELPRPKEGTNKFKIEQTSNKEVNTTEDSEDNKPEVPRPKDGTNKFKIEQTSNKEVNTTEDSEDNKPEVTNRSSRKVSLADKVQDRITVRQPAENSVTKPEENWIDVLVCKLEPWTANQIRKALATLSSEQLEAARIIIQHAQSNTTAKVAELDPKDVVGGHILTGKAGTGKTYAADVIITVLELLGFRVVACGTTGLASQNLKTSSDTPSDTLSRVLGLGTGFQEKWDANGNLLPRTEADLLEIITKIAMDDKVAKRLSESSYKKNYVGVVLLVDEAFMLGGDLGIAVAEGLKSNIQIEAQKGKARQRPVQLLMVGDPKQLEPVKDRMIFEDGEFLEYSDSTEIQKYKAFTERLNLKVIKLEKNERQSDDSAFGLELDLVGEGKAYTDLSNCPILLSRFKASLSQQPAEALHIIFNNDEVAKFNKSKLEELVRKGSLKREFQASMDTSRCRKSELLSYVTPTPELLELVVGAPVRVTQNIPKNNGTDDLLVANGERGTVVHMTKNTVSVKFKDGRCVDLQAIESRKIPIDENSIPIASFKQLPLCLCWATTFHGSQGQTYPKGQPVIVHMYSRKGGKHNGDLQRVWSYNAFYVACSRVTRSEDLFFYTGLGVDEKEEGVTDEEFTKQRMNTYFNHFKQSYRFNQKSIDWLDKQSC